MININKINGLYAIFSLWVLAAPLALAEGKRVFESQQKQTNLLELFSSEGCSSCPRADAWLASLKQHPGLWKQFIPIEFHVDYWNHLGWTDRFSKESFTSRQQQYGAEWKTGNVYTPGLVLNGTEWRPSPGSAQFTVPTEKRVGILRANRTAPTKFHVTFKPAIPGTTWKISGALMGNGLSSRVTSGENSSHTLQHEFVVLSLVTQKMENLGTEYSAVLELKEPLTSGSKSFSAAFWVTKEGEQKPVQAVGGDL